MRAVLVPNVERGSELWSVWNTLKDLYAIVRSIEELRLSERLTVLERVVHAELSTKIREVMVLQNDLNVCLDRISQAESVISDIEVNARTGILRSKRYARNAKARKERKAKRK